MGPRSRYLGADVPHEEFIWQDPLPKVDYAEIDETDIQSLKAQILNTSLSISELVSTAWASASTFRNSDKRGGGNGARIRLAPMNAWEVNKPMQLNKVLTILTDIQTRFNNAQFGGKKVSIADLIVLSGAAAIEKAAHQAGYDVEVPFISGRTDASQDQTDVESIAFLEPLADAFRNYRKLKNKAVSTEELLIDKAQLLNLSVPEMTVLIGGLRVLDINFDESKHGVFTSRPGQLTNDFFVNLLDMATQWKPMDETKELYLGSCRKSGQPKWTATRADLVFGSHAELRAVAEVYAESGNEKSFVDAFIKAWNKVMNADRFDKIS